MRQLRIAETEKYAHVTYFFNGGEETPFPGEDRLLVPSLSLAHFDDAPEMRAAAIAAAVVENMDQYAVIVANFANADMIGHSGNFKSAVAAVEALDEAVGTIVDAVINKKSTMIITADHGNVERKRDTLSGERLTRHSINPVPFFVVGERFRLASPRADARIAALRSDVGGILTDVAPTALALLGLAQPSEITGKNLLPKLLAEKQ
jgi:2,3-bisphosphoglycerate-independent phosphoglycerate mutase